VLATSSEEGKGLEELREAVVTVVRGE
jgi:hypothetical protein